MPRILMILSTSIEIAEFIRSREHIVLVAKDRNEPDENSKIEAVIPEDNGWEPLAAGEKAVVRLAVWKLQPGSKRVGHFQHNEGELLGDYAELC